MHLLMGPSLLLLIPAIAAEIVSWRLDVNVSPIRVIMIAGFYLASISILYGWCTLYHSFHLKKDQNGKIGMGMALIIYLMVYVLPVGNGPLM